MPQLLLVILFILYLILGLKMPHNVANAIDTNAGKIIVCVLALALFGYSNPILGILGIMVAYELIKSSSITTGSAALAKYYPTETKKWSPFNARHQFPYTLEQEIVKKMAPVRPTNYVSSPSSFKPILDEQHDAAPVNYQGVV
jgi:hypothetical protein